jgi:hypothetical protein
MCAKSTLHKTSVSPIPDFLRSSQSFPAGHSQGLQQEEMEEEELVLNFAQPAQVVSLQWRLGPGMHCSCLMCLHT